jgi:hypothetical protein
MTSVKIKVLCSWYDADGEKITDGPHAPYYMVDHEYDDESDRFEWIGWIQDIIRDFPDTSILGHPEHPSWSNWEHEGLRRCIEKGWSREVSVSIEGLSPDDWRLIRSMVSPDCGWDDMDLLRADICIPYTYGPYYAEVITFIYDTHRVNELGKPEVAYEVYHNGALVIQDDELWVSPMDAIDSLEVVETLWSFIQTYAEIPEDSVFSTSATEWMNINSELCTSVWLEYHIATREVA